MTSLIFFGSDRYSATVLNHLLASPSVKLAGVVTDQVEGGSPVEELAQSRQIPLWYYPDLPPRFPPGVVGLAASFDHLLPQATIARFKGKLYNLHPSLLPQYRNVSPVQYALALGDRETGITLFRLSEGIDNGEILGQLKEDILQTDTTQSLTFRLFARGAQLFLTCLKDPSTRKLRSSEPSGSALPLIFTRRLRRDSGFIEWSVFQKLMAGKTPSAAETTNPLLKLRLTHHPEGRILADLLRSLTPWPGVWSFAPTKKGSLRLALETVSPQITVKLAGKPKAIAYRDFVRYYL